MVVKENKSLVSPGIRLSSKLQLQCHTEGDTHARTLGSVVRPGQWHHVAISVLPYNMQPVYQVTVHVNEMLRKAQQKGSTSCQKQ